MSKDVSVKSKPYSPTATRRLLQQHPNFRLVRFTLRPSPTGLSCYREPQKLKMASKLWGEPVATYVPDGQATPHAYRTRDPEIDGAVVYSRLQHLAKGKDAQAKNAEKILKFVEKREEKDHLPRGLIHILLGLRLNEMDYARKTGNEDSFDAAAGYLLQDFSDHQNSRVRAIHWLRSFRQNLYQHLPLAFAYAEKLDSDHGEESMAPYNARLKLTILQQARSSLAKRVLLRDMESDAWTNQLPNAHESVAELTEAEKAMGLQSHYHDFSRQFKAQALAKLKLPANFFAAEMLFEGGHTREFFETLKNARRFILANQSDLTPEQLQIFRQALREIRKVFRQQFGKSRSHEMQLFWPNFVSHLKDSLPKDLTDKVLNPKALGLVLAQNLFKPRPSLNVAAFLEELVEGAHRWGKPQGHFQTYNFREDGFFVGQALAEVPGYEHLGDVTLEALQQDPRTRNFSEESLRAAVDSYWGIYWIKVLEKRTGKVWPDGASNEEVRAFALPDFVRYLTTGSTPDQLFNETKENIAQCLDLLSKHKPTDWSNAIFQIVLPGPKEGHADFFDAILKEFRKDPVAISEFFDHQIFANILTDAVQIRENERYTFKPGAWTLQGFFQYFEKMGGDPKIIAASIIQHYLADLCAQRIQLMQQDLEFEFSENWATPMIRHYREFPHETNGYVLGNGFNRTEFLAQRYPLIAREDMVAANPSEHQAILDYAAKEGLSIYLSSHAHTTADATASTQDIKTMLATGHPELIVSVSHQEARVYSNKGAQNHPAFLAALNRALQDA